jgi:hypothetical protein
MAPSQTLTPARPAWARKKPGRCAMKNCSRLGASKSGYQSGGQWLSTDRGGGQHHRMAGPWTGMRRPGTVEEAGPWTDMRRPGTVKEAGPLTDMPWYSCRSRKKTGSRAANLLLLRCAVEVFLLPNRE